MEEGDGALLGSSGRRSLDESGGGGDGALLDPDESGGGRLWENLKE